MRARSALLRGAHVVCVAGLLTLGSRGSRSSVCRSRALSCRLGYLLLAIFTEALFARYCGAVLFRVALRDICDAAGAYTGEGVARFRLGEGCYVLGVLEGFLYTIMLKRTW